MTVLSATEAAILPGLRSKTAGSATFDPACKPLKGVNMPLSAQEVFDSAIQFPLDMQVSIAERLVNNIEMHIHPDTEKQHCSMAKKRRDDVRSGKVVSLDGNFALLRVRKVLER